LTAFLVLPARVLSDAQADVEPRRLRVASDGRSEHLCSGLERAKLHQAVPPIEQVILGRIHVRGALIILGRRDEIARTLSDVAEQNINGCSPHATAVCGLACLRDWRSNEMVCSSKWT
jgi:hypothetical protein